MEDSYIIELLFERDESGIEALSEKYGNYSRYIAFNILHNSDDVSECINDSLLAVWDSVPPKKPDNLKVYFGKIVRNRAVNIFERNNAKKRGGDSVTLSVEELSAYLSGKSGENYGDLLDKIAVSRALDDFLESIGKEKRVVFIKRYWYMESYEQIAIECGFSLGKVKSVLHRLKKELAEFLKKEGLL